MRTGLRRLASAWVAAALLGAAPLSLHTAMAQAPASAGASVLDGVFTAAQAARGRQEFQRACLSCHSVGEHTGASFRTRWEGSSLGDLFDLISNTMPQSDPGSLAPEAYASILAFFLNDSGYKAGDQELTTDLEALKKIPVAPLP